MCVHFRVTLCLLFFYLHRCALTHFFRYSCACASCLRWFWSVVVVVAFASVMFTSMCSLSAMPTLIHIHTPSVTNPSFKSGDELPIHTPIHLHNHTPMQPYGHLPILARSHILTPVQPRPCRRKIALSKKSVIAGIRTARYTRYFPDPSPDLHPHSLTHSLSMETECWLTNH